MIEAALYDLDGLSVDSEPLHGLASERALNRYGRKHEDIPESVRRSFYGKRVIDVAAEVVGCLELPISPGQWAEERHDLFMQLVEEGISLMPGMLASLDFFESRGVRPAVVSSGDGRYVWRILELTGLAGRFESVVTGDDVSVGKPDPQCYLLAARRLGVNPASCVVLEDAYAGVCAGLAAGMRVIGIENRFNSRFEGADVVLPSLAGVDASLLDQLEALDSRTAADP